MNRRSTGIFVVIIPLVIISLSIIFIYLSQDSKKIDTKLPKINSREKYEIITLPITARGDEIDPGPIEDECKKDVKQYTQSSSFKVSGFSKCELFESKVGYSEKECPNGFSPQGCSICKLKCK